MLSMRLSGLAVVVALCGLSLGSARAETPLRDTIDAEIAKVWKDKGITPAPPASDGEFLRRAYLDLVGTIPTYEEAVAFLADESPDKRSKLIDRLLDDPRYAIHQANEWDMVLFGRNPPGYDARNRRGFVRFLQEQFAKNVPYDEITRTILKAEGNTVDDGAPMFLMQYWRSPEDATVAVGKIFLGVQLECARCHDHPYEDYKQVDFYGMAAFFARFNRVDMGKKGQENMLALHEKSTGDVLFTGPANEAAPGKKGKPVGPKFIKGEELEEPPLPDGFKEPTVEKGKLPPKPYFSRKDALADWITRPDNPWFAREAVNRVFAQLMGKGIVHPVDDLSELNFPSHPELLEALEKKFVAHKFDIKWLIREIANSKAYQIGSTGDATEPLPLYYERAKSRPLSAEQLVAAWRVASGYDEMQAKSGKEPPRNADAFSPLSRGYLMSFFGNPNDGQGNFQGGIHKHLYLNNGELGKVLVRGEGSLLNYLEKSEDPLEKKVERLFVQVLSRPPRDDERAFFVEYLSDQKEFSSRTLYAVWTLITCSEFRFNN